MSLWPVTPSAAAVLLAVCTQFHDISNCIVDEAEAPHNGREMKKDGDKIIKDSNTL